MAATGFTPISLYYSPTASAVPLAANLVAGELALNTNDGKLYYKNSSNVVTLLASATSGTFIDLTVTGVANFADGTAALPSITNTGDTNTGIFFPAADTIAFSGGGVESVRIDSSGNVGIGTSSPYTKLDVTQATGGFGGWKYALGANATDFPAIRLLATTANTGNIIAHEAGSLVFLSGTTSTAAGNERMRIDSTGKVGIGTASPAVTLAVSATDAILVPNGTTAQRPTGAAGYIRYNSTTASFEGYTSAWGSIGGGATGAGGDQVFYENGQTVTTNYSITASKNAGSFGPITINAGVTVTVPTGSTWSIV
jgi:hypothetical protein